MNVEIKNRFTGKIIIAGEYASIRDAVEKNKANLSMADLSGADLSGANLSGADLSRANLFRANLSWADLFRANLSRAELSWAELSRANLSRAELSRAELDFSCLHFSCKSLSPKTDERQRVQLAFHFLSWIKNSENATFEEKKIYNVMLDYANKFHRQDVKRLEKIEVE